MHKHDRRTLEECLYAIGHILEYTEGIFDMQTLVADPKTYDAVLMNFIVLGECATRLSEEVKAQAPDTDWRAIKDFRNFVAHDYFGLDQNIVWAAIEHHLPALKEDLEALVNKP
jgi:uncharacterized protein with HEPN domain